MIEICKKCGAEKDSETVFCDGCVAKSGSAPVPCSASLGNPTIHICRAPVWIAPERCVVLIYDTPDEAATGFEALNQLRQNKGSGALRYGR